MENSKSANIPVTLKWINYLLWSELVKTALGELWRHVSTGAAPKQIAQGEDGKEAVVVDEEKWSQEPNGAFTSPQLSGTGYLGVLLLL